MRRVATFVVVTVVGLFGVTAADGAETRVALVIGNAQYGHAPTLGNPLNDAEDISRALQRVGFVVTVLLDADYTALRRGLQQFGRAAAVADFAVVYYAGHGIEVDGRNFLIPVDAKLTRDADVEFETVPLNLVMRQLEGASVFRLAILDACRENPFARAMVRAGATRSIGQGLARIEPPGGTLVAYAAKDGELAQDGTGRNSPYTEALLRFLEEPDLEVSMMFRHVRDAVLAATGGDQEPFTYGSLPATGVYFRATRTLALELVTETQQPSTTQQAVVAPQPLPTVDPGPAAVRELIVDEVDEIQWTVQPADVYTEPDDQAPVAMRLDLLVEVNVTGRVRGADWLRVTGDDGASGYVVAALLSDRYPIYEADGVYRVERPANVRSGPGVGFHRVVRLDAGTAVRVTGKFYETDWLRIVLDDGTEGFLTAAVLSGEFPVGATSGRYLTLRAAEVRSGFGIGWETVARLERGIEVEATGTVQVGSVAWLRISPRRGSIGFVDGGELVAIRPASRFRDCEECPELALVPAGTYTMGSPSSEPNRYDDEGPQHEVRVAEPFAMGVYEVTFADWDRCVQEGGCGGLPPG